jgi:hypothetical protein
VKDYSSIIPDIQGLPEKMDEPTFKTRFDSIGSPIYQNMISEIDERIEALPLYQ